MLNDDKIDEVLKEIEEETKAEVRTPFRICTLSGRLKHLVETNSYCQTKRLFRKKTNNGKMWSEETIAEALKQHAN